MFKELFVFAGFGLAALGFWLLSPLMFALGILLLVFAVWWIRSTRNV